MTKSSAFPVPRLGLRALVAIFAVVVALAPAAVLLPTFASKSQDAVEEQSADLLQATGQQTANLLNRVLFAQWREVDGLARLAQSGGFNEGFRQRLETIKSVNDRYAWIGVAAPDGRVMMASGGLLEGQNVAARPWFTAGLEGPFAGDLHKALLLQQLLGTPGADPLRLLDFALPIRRQDDSVVAVLGSHLEWPWVRDLVRAAPLPQGADILLVSRDGTVIVGPEGLEGKQLSIRSSIAAGQGSSIVTEEAWPDGQRYVSAVVPVRGYRTLPSFGWSIIVRQPAAVAYHGVRELASGMIVPLLLVSATVLAVGLFFARFVGRPVAALAESATAMAGGATDVPVPEGHGYREAALISGALARMQSALTRAEDQAQVQAGERPPILSLVGSRVD